jgi:hypothetical protein
MTERGEFTPEYDSNNPASTTEATEILQMESQLQENDIQGGDTIVSRIAKLAREKGFDIASPVVMSIFHLPELLAGHQDASSDEISFYIREDEQKPS